MRLQSGERLGNYQILEPLGAGGMGEVYRARDERLERDVAVKVLSANLADSPEALARFEREAKAVAALSHPNLITIFDIGNDRGIYFAVMEYLTGETLLDRLAREPLPLIRVLEIGTAIADGLSAAHAQGVVHRDLKPANIFVTSRGLTKILDFGLARLMRHPIQAATLGQVTEVGQIMGTLGYMSPEQARGDISDARGDIFSLGCILFEMVTGRRAFPGQSAAEVLASVLRDDPLMPILDGLPSSFRDVLARSLAKSSSDRIQSADELATALRSLAATMDGDTVSATKPWSRGGTKGPSSEDSSSVALRPCVAVLPLQNFSAASTGSRYIVDAMTEMLIAELARNRALRVVSRTTAMQFRDSVKSLRQIASELGADAIVEGSMLLAGSSARITVQLIRANADDHLWAESYQRELLDVLHLQQEVARTIAEEIKKVFFDEIYRSESRRVLATLIRVLGDFEVADEALRESFAAATEQWPRDGMPLNPRAWLVSTGRAKGIDLVRRRAKHDVALQGVQRHVEEVAATYPVREDADIEDDRLRLIFTCCHPSLHPTTQVALTLREVCGLTTEEIGRAMLTTPSTIEQRIMRGKAKIRDARIAYQIPSSADLQERLASVLQVTYLVFNEGYAASSGESMTRHDLSAEAIRLGRLIVDLLPDTEAFGLLALMLIQESRRAARTSPSGDPILLENQDRSLWNRQQIRDGKTYLERALASPPVGVYTIQAAIAATHADAVTPADTDWNQIVDLYDLMLRIEPSPVIALNQAVAIAMRDGPAAGLELIDDLLESGELADYHLAHAARADLCRRVGKISDARDSYQLALGLVKQDPERRFLQRRLREIEQL